MGYNYNTRQRDHKCPDCGGILFTQILDDEQDIVVEEIVVDAHYEFCPRNKTKIEDLPTCVDGKSLCGQPHEMTVDCYHCHFICASKIC